MKYWTAVFCTTFLLISPIQAAKLEGRVLNILSGDRLELRADNQRTYTVRLRGIETPLDNTSAGRISQKHLAMLIAGKAVTVEYSNVDRRAAFIGKVKLGGSDINLRQVADGMARALPIMLFPNEKTVYQTAEFKARNNRLGIWRLSERGFAEK